MRKTQDIEFMLENAVAVALGLPKPHPVVLKKMRSSHAKLARRAHPSSHARIEHRAAA